MTDGDMAFEKAWKEQFAGNYAEAITLYEAAMEMYVEEGNLTAAEVCDTMIRDIEDQQ